MITAKTFDQLPEVTSAASNDLFVLQTVAGVRSKIKASNMPGGGGSPPAPVYAQLSTTYASNVNVVSYTPITWDLQDSVATGFTHSTSVNSDRLTVDADGVYQFGFNLSITSAVVRANVGARFRVNGSALLRGNALSAYIRAANEHDEASLHLTVIAELSAGDYVQVVARSEAAAGVATLASGESTFWGVKL